MKIECNRIEISEDDLGLEIEFLENEFEEDPESLDYNNITEVINSIGPYLLIQRSYPEDEFEKNYYYIESNRFDESGELKKFTFTLNNRNLNINWLNNLVEIELKVGEKDIMALIKALELFTQIDGKLKINH